MTFEGADDFLCEGSAGSSKVELRLPFLCVPKSISEQQGDCTYR